MNDKKNSINKEKEREEKMALKAAIAGTALGTLAATVYNFFCNLSSPSHDFSESLYSINDLLDLYSDDVDDRILSAEKDDDLRYAAGKFIIELDENDVMTITIDLYFKNLSDKLIRRREKNKDIDVKKVLNPSAIAKLKDKKIMEFKINHPDENKSISKQMAHNDKQIVHSD